MTRKWDQLPSGGRLWPLVPFGVAVFYAPLAFGCATPATRLVLDGLLGVSFLFWIAGLIGDRRKPQIPRACLVLGFLVVSWALVAWLNPRYYLEVESWSFVALPDSIPWLPGTVHANDTAPVVPHLLALILGFLVLVDLSSDFRSRWLLIRGVSLAVAVVAVVGIVQKAVGAEAMLWTTPERSGGLFFGAYRYHANAASLLNLGWPAALAVWLRDSRASSRASSFSWPLGVLLIIVSALFVNTSKAGHFLGIVGIVYAILAFRRVAVIPTTSRWVLGTAVVLGVGLALLVVLPGAASSIRLWEEAIETGGSLRGRLSAYDAAVRVLPDSGWLGTGPGTFSLVFPFYTNHLGDSFGGFWREAHQDYLQTLIEWGYLGTLLWVGLIGGGCLVGLRRVLQARRRNRIEISAHCALLAVGLLLLHALVDFPFQIGSIQFFASVPIAILWSFAGVREERHARKRKTGLRADDAKTRSSGEKGDGQEEAGAEEDGSLKTESDDADGLEAIFSSSRPAAKMKAIVKPSDT